MAVDEYIKAVTYPLSLLSTPVWLFDVDTLRVRWANGAALALWNSPSLQELQQRDMSRDISRTVCERLQQYCEDLTGTDKHVTEHWTFYPMGRPSSHECSISAIDNTSGERWLMVNATRQDTQSNSDTLYRSTALLHTSVCVSVYDRRGYLQYSNPAARRMLGTQPRSLAERFVDEHDWRLIRVALAQGAEANLEAEVATAEGTAWHSLTLELCPDPVSGRNSILVSEADVSDRRDAQHRVHQLAYSDTLTGLPNRTSWLNTLAARLNSARRHESQQAILFVDLDRFKLINDTLGHALGDQLLIAVAERLNSCILDSQFLARLGGDEFTLLLEDDQWGEQASQMARRIIDALGSPMQVEGHALSVTPSIGISLYPQHAADANQLMQQADLAMYAAKEAGGGFRVFQPHMTKQIQRRLRIENDLRAAIDRDGLQVHYQPKLRACDGSIAGMEALVRWNHPELGWVPPRDFISIAEETGMIADITRLVLHKAMRQQVLWSAIGYDVSVAINVSPLEFRRNDFTAVVKRALELSGCRPCKVELEITETMLMDDTVAVHCILDRLTGLGVKLSIDDFGSGFSNLGYLQRFPLDSIKIDQSFLRAGEISPVIELIIGVARKLSLSVVAEGVETREQRDYLIKHGCDQLQGFLFSKPRDCLHATAYLQSLDAECSQWPDRAVVAA